MRAGWDWHQGQEKGQVRWAQSQDTNTRPPSPFHVLATNSNPSERMRVTCSCLSKCGVLTVSVLGPHCARSHCSGLGEVAVSCRANRQAMFVMKQLQELRRGLEATSCGR